MRTLALLATVLAAALAAAPAAADVPATLNLAGRLTDAAGQPLSGAHDIEVRLYAVATGGTALWTEPHDSVMANAGAVFLALGDTVPFGAAAFDGGARWVELRIDGAPLAPRLPVASVPYALRAELASVADEALHADSADTALTAQSAVSAQSAQTAVTAQTATSADAATRVGSYTAAMLQPRVSGACAVGSSIRAIAADGTVTCETDDDTPTVYTAASGGGISIVGQSVALAPCAAGQVLKAGAAAGSWTCASASYGAGTGLTLSASSVFAVDSTVARKDAAAGNQAFDGTTLVLDYGNHRVGLGTAAPRERLDVGGPARIDTMRVFRKYGNNGTATCDEYCRGAGWPGGVGTCIAAKVGSSYVSCATLSGLGTNPSCMCAGIDE